MRYDYGYWTDRADTGATDEGWRDDDSNAVDDAICAAIEADHAREAGL